MGGSSSARMMQGMSMGGGHGAGAHMAPDLLPMWLGVLGVVMFGLIAGSHLRHLLMTTGERRPWHVCHVLMALGMACMFAPAAIDIQPVPAILWQLLFAVAAGATAVRWLAGWTGNASDNPLWLLTAIDLGAMVYMWSSGSFTPALTWVLVAYLVVEAGLWAVNAYRWIDAGSPIVGFGSLAPSSGGGIAVAGVASESLLGGLDIGLSMLGMALGMAYMLAAMQLMM